MPTFHHSFSVCLVLSRSVLIAFATLWANYSWNLFWRLKAAHTTTAKNRKPSKLITQHRTSRTSWHFLMWIINYKENVQKHWVSQETNREKKNWEKASRVLRCYLVWQRSLNSQENAPLIFLSTSQQFSAISECFKLLFSVLFFFSSELLESGIIYRGKIGKKSLKIVFVVCAAWRGQNSRVLKYCLLLLVNYGDSLVACFTPLFTELLSHQPTAMPAEIKNSESKQTDWRRRNNFLDEEAKSFFSTLFFSPFYEWIYCGMLWILISLALELERSSPRLLTPTAIRAHIMTIFFYSTPFMSC